MTIAEPKTGINYESGSEISCGLYERVAVTNSRHYQRLYCAYGRAVGYKAIYLSGGGVANASYGLPDWE